MAANSVHDGFIRKLVNDATRDIGHGCRAHASVNQIRTLLCENTQVDDELKWCGFDRRVEPQRLVIQIRFSAGIREPLEYLLLGQNKPVFAYSCLGVD